MAEGGGREGVGSPYKDYSVYPSDNVDNSGLSEATQKHFSKIFSVSDVTKH